MGPRKWELNFFYQHFILKVANLDCSLFKEVFNEFVSKHFEEGKIIFLSLSIWNFIIMRLTLYYYTRVSRLGKIKD